MAHQERRNRRRPAKSCEQCRRRKVRCDLNVPCGPCTRARSSLNCSYRHAVISPTPTLAQTSASVSDTHQDVSSPPKQLTPSDIPHSASLVEGDSRDNNIPRSDTHGSASVRDIRRHLQRLEERLSNCERNNTSSVAHDPSLDQALHDVDEKVQRIERHLASTSDPVDLHGDKGLSIPAVPSRLHVSANKTRVLGPPHWIHKVDQLQFIQPFNAKEPEPSFQELKADLGNLVKECRGVRQSIKTQQSIRLIDPVPDLCGSLPNRSVCDELVRCYLRTFELIYRVIHIPSFWKEYEQFWEQPQMSPTSFTMKLVLILAIGSAFYPRRGRSVDDQFLHLVQTWIYAAQWWLAGPTEKSTFNLDGLQVFCLLLIARQTSVLGASPWLSSGSLLKMAMAMGLDRDPSCFPSLSIFQSEMRVRLWATVLELTLQSSSDSTAPALLCQDANTRNPLNINDREITQDTNVIPMSRPSHEFTESSIQILLHESSVVRAKAIQFIYNRPTQSYQKALQLSGELRNACHKISVFFHSSISHQSGNSLGPTEFHHKFLDMDLQRYILSMHTPFMVQARRDPHYLFSRKACLESAMVIASYTDGADFSSNNTLDDLSRLTVVGRGFFKGPLSLDIISVLGLEIVTQLEEEASSSSSASSYSTSAPEQPAPHTNIPGPLKELAKASRAPLLRSLERILEQLLQFIALGSPSTKRYNFLAAMLGQIRAMESGQCVKRVVYETIKQSLKNCYDLLQSNAALMLSTTEMSARNAEDPSDSILPGFDLDVEDPIFDLDLPSLLCVPGLADINSSVF